MYSKLFKSLTLVSSVSSMVVTWSRRSKDVRRIQKIPNGLYTHSLLAIDWIRKLVCAWCSLP